MLLAEFRLLSVLRRHELRLDARLATAAGHSLVAQPGFQNSRSGQRATARRDFACGRVARRVFPVLNSAGKREPGSDPPARHGAHGVNNGKRLSKAWLPGLVAAIG